MIWRIRHPIRRRAHGPGSGRGEGAGAAGLGWDFMAWAVLDGTEGFDFPSEEPAGLSYNIPRKKRK